jgi:LysM repeat protein
MTRETKIGLLVGLAFIIVIGILLSDHLTQSTEPQPAVLAVAGNGVRSATAVPGVTGAANPPITQVAAPTNVQPANPVPTRDELTPHAPPVQIVKVGAPTITTGSANDQQQTNQARTEVTSSSGSDSTDSNTTDNPPAPPVAESNSESTGGGVANALQNAAKQHGEELVPVGGSSKTTPSTPTQTGTKQYVAVEGDSLSKIAAKVFGSNTKANREAIIAVNPGLKSDPNKIIVGKTYNIPASGGTESVATQTPAPQPAPTVTTATNDKSNWYTVKEGDTLSAIAQEQCGTIGAIAAILELNKDSLKDANHVVVNMKLRLPNKPVATAAN